jgi:hypothetical protein
MVLFRRDKKPKFDPYEASLARAVPASATVVAGRQTTHTSQDVNSHSEVYEVELDVTRADAGADVIRQTVYWTVFNVALSDIQAGVTLSVTVDPEFPAVVYPPGYPPPNTKPGVISLRDARILPASKWLEQQLE